MQQAGASSISGLLTRFQFPAARPCFNRLLSGRLAFLHRHRPCSLPRMETFLAAMLYVYFLLESPPNVVVERPRSCEYLAVIDGVAALRSSRHGSHHHTEKEYFWTARPHDNSSLLELLGQGGVIKSKRVVEAMEQIDRKLFVPDKAYAYMDNPMPIGFNATISAPHMHGLCLELLQNHLKPGMRALDVGSGTGYLTACFALMVGEEGRAVGVEHIPQLVEGSVENVKASKAASLLESGKLSFHTGDGRNGWPDAAPYDAIHVGAAAPVVPDALLQQLSPGGRMVIPVGQEFQELRVIDKQDDGSLREWSETSVRYVPLTSKNEQLTS